jgi:Niemann-Pick C1 protein
MWQDVIITIGTILCVIQLFSSLWLSFLVTLIVFMFFVELIGVLWVINIVTTTKFPVEMNAIFCANLVISLGFGVQFCIYIARSFERQRGLTGEERSMKALF